MRLIPLILLSASAAYAADDQALFEKKVRPLLIEHCLACHGPEKHKGGLRLDHREGWQKGGDSGPAIVAGNVDSSLVAKAISYTDRDLKMPPKQKLEAADAEILRQWIASGAYDPRTLETASTAKPSPAATAATHWAYQPIQRPKAPAIKDASWARNDIDRFILAELEKRGIAPAPNASAEVMKRRLAYDLTGLPQTGTEDDSPDLMLASNAFAEHWGQHWLDASRFSESSGGGRTLPFKDAWRYRDYVIESIRDDMPLNQFITEQIAGDLLPHATPADQRRHVTATGFLVLGPNNYEEQDKSLLRMDIVDEQLDVIGRSLLGMSISCARCHDHKFDPIPTRDYYALAGILRSTKMIRDPKENVAHWIDTPLKLDGAAEAKMQQHEKNIAAITKQLDAAKKELKKLAPKTEPKDGNSRSLAIDEVPGIVVDDSQAKVVGEWKRSTFSPTFIGEGYLSDKNDEKGAKTLTFMPKIEKAGRYEVWFAYPPLVNRAKEVPVTVFHADGEDVVKVDESEVPAINGRYIRLGQFRFESSGQGFVMVATEGTKGFVVADAVTFIPVDEVAKLSLSNEKELEKNPRIAAASKRIKALEADLKKAEKASPPRPEAMSVVDHEEIGDCPIHIRGNLRNLGEKAPRGYIQAAYHGDAPKVPADQSGRLQLAQWITSPQNTLTARVLANRVWMHLFGEGLVRSAENFGVTGDKPTHPELLDHLATKLIDGGWSLKKLVRYIVDSHTYAMTSVVKPGSKGESVDPDNHLLWRQNRKRMEAGQLRDTMLVVAGTLDARFLGPTIGSEGDKIADPNDAKVQNLEYGYVFTDARRSVYTPAFRNRRLELFEAFDFGSNNQAIAKRNTSTVSPQALYLLNHEFTINQSRAAAKRLLSDASLKNDTARLNQAFQLALGRRPTTREAQMTGEFIAISPGEADAQERTEENWSLLMQSLFASVDFRFVE
jgi:cytochrome c553